MTTGIYGIFCKRSGECLYVGQSKRIEDRWRSHQKRLLGGTHLRDFIEWFQSEGSNLTLMELRTLEETADTDKDKNEAEIRWFNKLSPRFYGQIPSLNNSGWRQAEETKRKISESLLGNYHAHVYTCIRCGVEFETRRKKKTSNTYCTSECYRGGKENQVDLEEIYRLYYEEKRNIRYTSTLLGLSDGALLRIMRKNGMMPRPRGNKVSQGSIAQSG